MKTARFLVLAVCVFSSQIAFGQYEKGVPPVYLPKLTKDLSKTINGLKSDQFTNVTSKQDAQTAPAATSSVAPAATQPAGTAAPSDTGCNSGCNSGCDSGCCQSNCGVGRSFFRRGGCGSTCNSSSSRIKFSINRGPVACDQCGCDNRSFLQRILPISINMRSNHESRYFGIFGGYHDMQDIRATDRLLDFDDSFILGFTRGRRFCNRIRMEAEFSIRDAPAGEYFEGMFVGDDFVPSATYDGRDGFTSLTSMRNVLVDFNGVRSELKPYVGLGLGGTFVTGDFINDGLGRADWINDVAFCYQFIIGATRKIRCTNNEAYVEFRHFGTSGLELENDAGDPTTDFAFQNNTVVFGLRFNRPACCGN